MSSTNVSAMGMSTAAAAGAAATQYRPLPIVPPGPGLGRAIAAVDQTDVMTSAGYHLRVSALWHLELSTTKHMYLARFNGRLMLHVREFRIDENHRHAIPTSAGVTLNLQQTRDFIQASTDLITVVDRDEIMKEVQDAITEHEEGYDGMVADISMTHDMVFPIPPAMMVAHFGRLLFGIAQCGSIEFKQFFVPEGAQDLTNARPCRFIRLNREEARIAVDGVWSLTSRWRNLNTTPPCSTTHISVAASLICRHCCPTSEEVTCLPLRQQDNNRQGHGPRNLKVHKPTTAPEVPPPHRARTSSPAVAAAAATHVQAVDARASSSIPSTSSGRPVSPIPCTSRGKPVTPRQRQSNQQIITSTSNVSGLGKNSDDTVQYPSVEATSLSDLDTPSSPQQHNTKKIATKRKACRALNFDTQCSVQDSPDSPDSTTVIPDTPSSPSPRRFKLDVPTTRRPGRGQSRETAIVIDSENEDDL